MTKMPKTQSKMKTRILKLKSTDTSYSLFQECKALFPCWAYNEDWLKTIKSDRAGDYEVEVADTVEPDGEGNLSYNGLKAKGIQGITLEERLRFEIDYYKETGKHLDIKNLTLCSGSVFADGGVPSVGFSADDGEVCVDSWYPDNADDCLRFRPIILKSSPFVSLPDTLEINGVKYVKK